MTDKSQEGLMRFSTGRMLNPPLPRRLHSTFSLPVTMSICVLKYVVIFVVFGSRLEIPGGFSLACPRLKGQSAYTGVKWVVHLLLWRVVGNYHIPEFGEVE